MVKSDVAGIPSQPKDLYMRILLSNVSCSPSAHWHLNDYTFMILYQFLVDMAKRKLLNEDQEKQRDKVPPDAHYSFKPDTTSYATLEAAGCGGSSTYRTSVRMLYLTPVVTSSPLWIRSPCSNTKTRPMRGSTSTNTPSFACKPFRRRGLGQKRVAPPLSVSGPPFKYNWTV